jgi:hypothetical protein
MPNNTFERTVEHCGPRLASARASWPAAQRRALDVAIYYQTGARMRHAIFLALSLLFGSLSAFADCAEKGMRTQSVSLSVEGKRLETWLPVPGEIRRRRLPGGFELGIQIDPTTPEKYRELFAKHDLRGFDELVKISLYDMNGAAPKLVSTTWGGANSLQGFGRRGGANGVDMSDQIELWFHKPVCITPTTLAQ